MGKKSQRKGRSAELELVRLMQEAGIKARAGEAVSYGSMPDVVGIDGIHAEVKRVERLNLSDAMSQSVRDSQKFRDGSPAVFHRRNRQPWLVTMRLCDWLTLYKAWKSGE